MRQEIVCSKIFGLVVAAFFLSACTAGGRSQDSRTTGTGSPIPAAPKAVTAADPGATAGSVPVQRPVLQSPSTGVSAKVNPIPSGSGIAAPRSNSSTMQSALEAPDPVPFEASISRAGLHLFDQAGGLLGSERRTVVIDPLIDANTGAQTVSTARMGSQLESIIKSNFPNWAIAPLTRQTLSQQPLLLIGTLTPVNVVRAVDTPPDAFRVWLTLIDLRTGKVVAKKIDRATVDSVNPEPLRFYRDSPTWHKDKTVLGYINSCQINTKIGDPADPDYLARLPAAAVVNEAIMAYDKGSIPEANKLYRAAESISEPGDMRVLNGLYLTNWQLGQREQAKNAFARLVESGLELKRLPVKLLFVPGKTTFNQVGDLPQQYQMWISALAEQAGKVGACVRVVGHTSRTGSARLNETLSRQRAETVEALLKRDNRALSTRLSVSGVGSKEALVGLGTDDFRDALDRRVEFRVVDCV